MAAFKRKRSVATFGSWSVIVEICIPHLPKKKTEIRIQRVCFLWNSNSHEKIMLPDIHHDALNLYKFILVSPPTESGYLVAFFYRNPVPGLAFCGQGDKNWYYLEFEFLDAISCNGDIYAITNQGLCISQISFISPEQINIEPHDGVPTHTLMKREQLVDSCGALYLVQRKSTSVLEVFQRDFTHNRWFKISSLGNKVFVLIGNYSASFSATELGIRGNCIYFTEDGDDEKLYMFSLDDKTLSVTRNGPESGTLWFLLDGLMPRLRVVDNPKLNEQITSKEVKKIMQTTEESEEILETYDSVWSKLPTDIQKLIGKSITTGWGYMNFRAVCRRWSSLVPPIRWKPNPVGVPLKYPWLMFPQKGAVYSFYDPMCKVTYHMEINELEGCEILFSNNGWLLVSQHQWSMFFFEPFTRTKIQLPDLLEIYCFAGISFSGSPANSNWQIFGTAHGFPRRTFIILLRSSDENWIVTHVDREEPFLPSVSNPVYWRGRFCCLGQDGSLGIFELWDTGHHFHVFSSSLHLFHKFHKTYRSFLVPAKRELYSVFVSDMGNLVRVFKLNMHETIWVELKSLKNEVLFSSLTSSLAVQTVDKTMKNTIQLSSFNNVNESNIFYSLKSGRYEIFNSDYSNEYLYDTKELVCGTWIQPIMVLDVK